MLTNEEKKKEGLKYIYMAESIHEYLAFQKKHQNNIYQLQKGIRTIFSISKKVSK
jgi:hypothetical protein